MLNYSVSDCIKPYLDDECENDDVEPQNSKKFERFMLDIQSLVVLMIALPSFIVLIILMIKLLKSNKKLRVNL